ncbi:hypothetical protein OURE66S_03741 [Oligella ureolytica]
MPDKAIDVLDEAGAAQRLLPKSRQKKLLGKPEIEMTIAKMARISSGGGLSDERGKLQNLEAELKATIFGQDEAIVTLAAAMKMAHSGLGREDKPIGSFLFSGPTGVGKTEVSKQLAEALGIELVRFDMSEYMEAHAVSRLIGAPPGYVGYDDGGLLTEQINKHPHCVLLLDEIEKANPAIYNILLQVMDHGTLTDTNGRKAGDVVINHHAGAKAGTGSVVPPVGEGGRESAYKMAQNDDLMARAVVEDMVKRGFKKVAYIGFADAYGDSWWREFSAAAESKLDIVAKESFQRTDSSTMGQVLKLMSAKPDAILVAGSGTPAVLPQQTLKERGYQGQIYRPMVSQLPSFCR